LVRERTDVSQEVILILKLKVDTFS